MADNQPIIEENQSNEEKIADQGISYASGGAFVRWLDNFWYHNKWRVLIAAFALFVVGFCVIQQFTDLDEDTTVTYVGPYTYTGEELENIRDALNRCIPEDWNGDGEAYTAIVRYTVYSPEELEKDKEENQGSGTVNTAYNAEQLRQFNQFLVTGECSVYFCSPYMYAYIKEHGNLRKLADVLGQVPENAVDEYAVALKDTLLYHTYPAMQKIPEDTYIVLLVPYVMGESSDETVYANSVAYFQTLIR